MKSSVLVLAVSLSGLLVGWAGTSIGACNLQAQKCYDVVSCTLPKNCFQLGGVGNWLKITTRNTEYDCKAAAGTNKQCDLDNATLNNLCAVADRFATQADCNNNVNKLGTLNIWSAALCAGSNPC